MKALCQYLGAEATPTEESTRWEAWQGEDDDDDDDYGGENDDDDDDDCGDEYFEDNSVDRDDVLLNCWKKFMVWKSPSGWTSWIMFQKNNYMNIIDVWW